MTPRVVGLEHNAIDVMDTSVFESAFEASFVKMLNGKSLVCAQTGASIVAHPARVTTIILDVLIFYCPFNRVDELKV